MMITVIGTTRSLTDGAATFTPSIADRTEMAGVIIESPKKSAAPKTPSSASVSLTRLPAADPLPPDQRDQRHDPALSVVVRAHDEEDVGDGDDDRHRPEDHRDDAEDRVARDRDRVRVARVEERLDGVERARADVAEDDAERAERECGSSGDAASHAPTLRVSRGGRTSTTRVPTIEGKEPMAELTTLESKLGEVVGLAMAAQEATKKVMQLPELEDELAQKLEQMSEEAAEAERRGTEIASNLEGKKTAILEEARQTKSKAKEMLTTYLDEESDALDGFEFLTMAEAGEVGHWSVLETLNQRARDAAIRDYVEWGLPIQQRHFQDVQLASTQLASEKDPQEVE